MKKILFILSIIFLGFWIFFYRLPKPRLINIKPKIINKIRFASWADTKNGVEVLSQLSNQINAIDQAPKFTLYEGDLQGDGFDLQTIARWDSAFNGDRQNGILAKTFFVRGNHDNNQDNSASNWQNYFDMGRNAAAVGAKNYSFMPGQNNLTYSFDYLNSHFVGIDIPGDNTLFTSDQFTWTDKDIKQAETRGITHTFLFFHGPLYFVDDHFSQPNPKLIQIINNHPTIKALFHGHEHVMAYVHLDSKRIPTLKRPIEQFVTGAAGANLYECNITRSDYCDSYQGFAIVDINQNSFNVSFYKMGDSQAIKKWGF